MPSVSATTAAAFALLGCARTDLDTRGMSAVPGGDFVMGSTVDERALALELSYAAQGGVVGDTTTWLRNELDRTTTKLEPFWIMTRPVSQMEYLVYVTSEGAPEPYVDPDTWTQIGGGRPYAAVLGYLWKRGSPAPDRMNHPVVLVSQSDAAGYCRWWGLRRGGKGSLPTEPQWEKAARGGDGREYPWGSRYDPVRLNSSDLGHGDTIPIGLFPESASPYGVLDMAGNVFEWTATREPGGQVVKGGSWSSDGSTARAAARHLRAPAARLTTIGFRCILAQK